MKVTVYLPDEIGAAAKAAELNLSGLLRDSVQQELERRLTMAQTLSKTAEHLLDLESDDGPYVGRITGAVIAQDDDVSVYLTDDERVIVHEADRLRFWEVNLDPSVFTIAEQLPAGVYVETMRALGMTPVVDL